MLLAGCKRELSGNRGSAIILMIVVGTEFEDEGIVVAIVVLH